MTKDTIIAVHQILREDLFEQLRTKERIDTKISIVAGFNAVLLVLCLELYPHVDIILFCIGMVLLLASLGLLFMAYRTLGWRFSPSPQALIEELNEGKGIKEIYIQTIGDIGGVPDIKGKTTPKKDLGAFRQNKKRLDYKSHWLNRGTYMLFLGLVGMTLSRILA